MKRIEICESPEALADRVALELLSILENRSGPFSIALAGGSTPKRLYERLAQPDLRKRVNWDQLEVFFSDERAVPLDHPDSNFRMAHEALLRHVPDAIVSPMPAAAGEADAYAMKIVNAVPIGNVEDPRAMAIRIPRFDLILLGIGTDGHTASLFPGTAALEAQPHQLVVMNEVPQLQTRRMTFTFPLINAAKRVWVLATGAEKRPVLERVFEERDCPYPVCQVAPRLGELVWWLDRKAAPGAG